MKFFRYFLAVATIAFMVGCGSSSEDSDKQTQDEYKLSIFHVNDGHSHLAADTLSLNFGGIKTKTPVGGMPSVVAKINELKNQKPNSLILNAGDTFQGTLYYSIFKGEADAKMLNLVKWDAIELGNHEFDDGDNQLAKYIDLVNAPWLGANVVADVGSVLDNKWKPYIIKEVNGEKIGIIGIDIVQKTKISSSPSEKVKFYDEVQTAQKYIDELTRKNINKIILLSHVGLENDKQYATKLKGVDVIVGGDSHTLMGDFSSVGLTSGDKNYPAITTSKDGKKVCIVQAWNYSYVVGDLDVSFDKNGDVISCKGTPTLLLPKLEDKNFQTGKDESKKPIYATKDELEKIKSIINKNKNLQSITPDELAEQTLKTYTEQIDAKKSEVLGKSAQVLYHTRVPMSAYGGAAAQALGSDVAPIICKAFYDLSKRSSICIQNAGGVRESIKQGDITMGDAYAMLPFANTLFEIEMKGSEIKQVLEDALSNIYENGGSTGAFPYAYGLKYDIDISKGKDKRISGVEVKDRTSGAWSEIQNDKMYVIVTNAYTAGGKDGYVTFKKVQDERGKGVDTYLDYAMSYVKYLQNLTAQNKQVQKLPSIDHPIKSFKP